MRTVQLLIPVQDEDFIKTLRYKVAYVSSEIRDIEDDGSTLSFKVPSARADETEAIVKRMMEEMKGGYRDVPQEIRFKQQNPLAYPTYDVYEALVDQQWVVPYEQGLVGFGKQFLKMYQALDHLIVHWSNRYQAAEYIYPDLIGIDTLNQYDYVSQFPNHLMFASHLREDIDLIQTFSREAADGCDCYHSEYIAEPRLVNKLAVCPHVFKQYEGRIIDLKEPIIVTSVGKCKRYESVNMNRVERLLDFSMREIVIIGSHEQVLQVREEWIELVQQLIQSIQVETNIKTGNDPFFTNEYSPKAMLQQKLKLKYELNLYLPYNKKELSVGSFNYHGTHFAESFSIEAVDGRNVHTGCIAFGLERFVYGILAQIGLERAEEMIERITSCMAIRT
ncbi:aminoacyl--tRNA ligase-related protein [Paenibacillus xylanexedens]|uniref:aminoacyl--tRNA ligase-related protein n=1 Tax=Paenibacillus xylanexedens TaxID=528191 RepID=UPI00119F3824|nr:aminoacyl--tRNA ligase-related protein [Paenibacillus xylanexedens]